VKSDLYIKILHFQFTQKLLKFNPKSPFSDESTPFLRKQGTQKKNHRRFISTKLILILLLLAVRKNPSLSKHCKLIHQILCRAFSIIFDFVCWGGYPLVVPITSTNRQKTQKLFNSVLLLPQPTLILFIQVNQG